MRREKWNPSVRSSYSNCVFVSLRPRSWARVSVLAGPAYHPGMTRRNCRRTSFKRPDGRVDVASNDWTLSDDAGRALAHIYRYLYGSNAGRWFWTVLIAPDGTPFNAGAGFAATEAEAREICEAIIPPGAQERGSCCDEGGEMGVD
jgi:hypothetical protein